MRSVGLRHRWAAYRAALHAVGTELACTGVTLTGTLILILTLTPLSLYTSIATVLMNAPQLLHRSSAMGSTVGHPNNLAGSLVILGIATQFWRKFY